MLDRIFNMDNPLMRALSIAADLLLLNVLTAVCSLPVVTFGAAYTSLCDVTMQLVRNEDSYLAKSYFASFRRHWKRSLPLGLLFLLAALVLALDFRLADLYLPLLRIPVAAVGILVLAIALYSFFAIIREGTGVRQALSLGLERAVLYFPRTLLMLLAYLGFLILLVNFWRILLPVALLLGFSLPCYICALLQKDLVKGLQGDRESDIY